MKTNRELNNLDENNNTLRYKERKILAKIPFESQLYSSYTTDTDIINQLHERALDLVYDD